MIHRCEASFHVLEGIQGQQQRKHVGGEGRQQYSESLTPEKLDNALPQFWADLK